MVNHSSISQLLLFIPPYLSFYPNLPVLFLQPSQNPNTYCFIPPSISISYLLLFCFPQNPCNLILHIPISPFLFHQFPTSLVLFLYTFFISKLLLLHSFNSLLVPNSPILFLQPYQYPKLYLIP